MQKPLLLLATLLICHALSAAVYKGTIGKYAVYFDFELPDSDDDVYGSYFYESKTINIPFTGSLHGKQLTLHAGSGFMEDDDKEIFRLVRIGSTLSGTWECKGKKLEVSLKTADPALTANPFTGNPFFDEKRFSGIDYIRTALAKFRPIDSITAQNGIVLSWYVESHTGAYLFRVIKGLPEQTMRWLNNKLEIMHLSDFCSYGSCGDAEMGFEFSSDAGPIFINSDFFSLNMSYGYYCGGAHPDFGTVQFNFDLRKQLELETEDLLRFPGSLHQTEDNFDAWSAYREDFGVRIAAYLKKIHPAYFVEENEETDTDSEEACNYNDPSVWEFSDVLITPEGFRFGAYFARYMRSCDDPEWAVIPYEVIAEFIHPAYREQLLALPNGH